MGHDFFSAVVCHRQARPAVFHQLLCPLHNCGEGIDRNVHRRRKVTATGIHVTSAQFAFVGKSDGMNDEIQRAPFFFDCRKERIHGCFIRYVTWQDRIASQLCSQRRHPLEQRVTLVGECQFRSGFGTAFCDAPCDGFVIGQPHYETTFACQKIVSHHVPFYNVRCCFETFRRLRWRHQDWIRRQCGAHSAQVHLTFCASR